MATPTRIYIVTGPNNFVALVRAAMPAGAIRHVTRSAYNAEVASQDDLVALLAKGVQVQEAGAETAAETLA